MCRAIIDGLMMQWKRRGVTLNASEEEQEVSVIRLDDAAGEEVLWCAIRRAREVE